MSPVKYLYGQYNMGADMIDTHDLGQSQKFDIFRFHRSGKIALLVAYIIIYAFTVIFGVHLLTYILFLIIFLILASCMGGYKFVDTLQSMSKWQKILLIFSVAFLLRALMLFQNQIITWDIDTYVWRSENMLDGQIPYADFYGGNKPPLYQYMLFIMGYVFTPGMVQFRAVFSFFDALIPVVLFFICKDRYNERFAIISSLIYTIFPIGIICTGLSGHFDSLVALFTLISIFLLFRNKMPTSALSLGIGFALKIYPIVLLPFFITTIKSWRKKIEYIIFFSIPTLIADGILYLISPKAFFEYLDEEARWEGTSSFSSIIEMMTESTEIFSVKISWIVLGFFGILLLVMLTDWISPRRYENVLKWYKIIIVVYVFYFAFYIIYGVLYYNNPFYLVIIPLAIYAPCVILFYKKILPKLIPKSLTNPENEALFIISAFAIILFMMGLPNIAPWYFIWFFPFFLVIDTNEIRNTLIWLFPWHGIGKEMVLIPGTGKVN